MYTVSTALVDGLIAIVGFAVLAAIGMRYPRSRMFTVPFAGIWLTFWTMQTAEAMGVSNRIHLLIVAMVAVAVATIITVTIPYTIEDRRKKTGRA
jgi:hypothetical protein